MPSPFPGMDPFLEDPVLWPGFHNKLISEMQTVLVAELRPKYAIRIEERVFVSEESDPGRQVIIPDLRIHNSDASSQRIGGRSDEALVDVAEPLVVVTLLQDEIREPYLGIYDAESRTVVAVIEILSPTNKHPGASGQRTYLQKRREIMESDTHLVEIDLLRGGQRMAVAGELPPCDYLVHVSPQSLRPVTWMWTLRDRIPKFRVPLKPEDGHLVFDLQEVFDVSYDRAGYAYDLDYRRAPVPPLPAEDAVWADELLKSRNCR